MKKILGLAAILYSSMSAAEEVCSNAHITKQSKSMYENMVEDISLPNRYERILKRDEFEVKFCYKTLNNVEETNVSIGEGFHFAISELEKHLGSLSRTYSLKKTFNTSDIQVKVVDDLYFKISQDILAFANGSITKLNRSFKSSVLGESNMDVINDGKSLEVRQTPILIARRNVDSLAKLYTTLFAEVLHHELHPTTLNLMQNRGSVDAGILAEEAVVHNITMDWVRELSVHMDNIDVADIEDLHKAMQQNPRYSLYKPLYDSVFSKSYGLSLRKDLLNAYMDKPELVYRAIINSK